MSFQLRVTGPDAAYGGSFLSVDSSGNVKIDRNVKSSETVYVRVTAGAYSADTTTFLVTTSCGASYTISESGSTT
jgi:hypothetical protein